MSEPATSPQEPRCYPLPDGLELGPVVEVGQVYESRKDGARWRVEEIPTLIDNRLLVKHVNPAEPGLRTPRVGVDRKEFLKAHKLVIDPNRPALPNDQPTKPANVEQEIVAGSVVWLRGGGPRMTVLQEITRALVEVAYVPEYGTNGRIRREQIPIVALTTVPPSS